MEYRRKEREERKKTNELNKQLIYQTAYQDMLIQEQDPKWHAEWSRRKKQSADARLANTPCAAEIAQYRAIVKFLETSK